MLLQKHICHIPLTRAFSALHFESSDISSRNQSTNFQNIILYKKRMPKLKVATQLKLYFFVSAKMRDVNKDNDNGTISTNHNQLNDFFVLSFAKCLFCFIIVMWKKIENIIRGKLDIFKLKKKFIIRFQSVTETQKSFVCRYSFGQDK